MYEPHIERILSLLNPRDKVLDIGGWGKPFNRANHVVDLMPYETRGFYGCSGPTKEHFTKETWHVQDVSSSKPLPFKDKEFDFVICSHTLEDIRDPLQLCSEINRIGKRGYIEVPSRLAESTLGEEGPHYVGLSHHRWLVEISDNEIVFRFKQHIIHDSWKYHFPKGYLKNHHSEKTIAFLFWDGSFKAKEAIEVSFPHLCMEMEQFVRKYNAYPEYYYELAATRKKVLTAAKSFLRRSGMFRAILEKFAGKRLGTSEGVDRYNSFWSKISEIYTQQS